MGKHCGWIDFTIEKVLLEVADQSFSFLSVFQMITECTSNKIFFPILLRIEVNHVNQVISVFMSLHYILLFGGNKQLLLVFVFLSFIFFFFFFNIGHELWGRSGAEEDIVQMFA